MIPVTESGLKKMARTLASSIKYDGAKMPHSQALENLSKVFGYANYNTLVAVLRGGKGSDERVEQLRTDIEAVLDRDPDEMSPADVADLAKIARKAAAESDSMIDGAAWDEKRLTRLGRLIAGTIGKDGASARGLMKEIPGFSGLIGREPKGAAVWTEFCAEVMTNSRFWKLARTDAVDGEEFWLVLTPADSNEIWGPATNGRERKGRFIAVPFRWGEYLVEMASDRFERMVVSDNPRDIVNTVKGKRLAVWKWRRIERSINAATGIVEGGRLLRKNAAFVLYDEALASGERSDNLWSLGFDGGPSLDPRETGDCDDMFVVWWVIEIISFVAGVKDMIITTRDEIQGETTNGDSVTIQ